VLDDKVISAPVIREPILGGQGQISGNFNAQSANDLAVLLRAGALPATLTVLTNKSAKPALLEVVGPEGLRLPIGRLDTLRLRAQAEDGSLTIDIWLASRYGMLPVRIRIADDEGEVLDQQAIQLRLTPAGEPTKSAEDDEGGGVALTEPIELKEEIDPLADLYRN